VSEDPQIRFRPLALDDLELMHHWLKKDFVARWWPGWPTREQVRAKYQPRIEGRDPTKCYLIGLEGKPVGFIQCYRDVVDAPHFARLFEEPRRTAGIDLFLGDRRYAYQGLGPRAIAKFLREVVFAPPETDVCMIDPAQNNRAAIRAYEKVGFRYLATVHAPGELEPAHVMIVRRAELAHD
jgi:RimJ/RimL family protein N-acetyltransferase